MATEAQRRHRIASIAGDGIGPEVVDASRGVLEAAAAIDGAALDWTHLDWGSDHHRRTGAMMPSDGLDTLATHDAILFGAVGAPDIPDDVTLWGLLIPIRRAFDQYVNLRPVRTYPGVRSPLADPAGIDMVIVRENVEGEYSTVGGRYDVGTPDERAVQEAIFTRTGTERIARYAVDVARTRSGRIVSATKSNGIIHSMPFWDEVVAGVVAEAGDVELRSVLIDALAAEVVLKPRGLDVIVASNLFGDILSDLATACVGSIGLAMSGNIDPSRTHPSMFEPVHGSAPDIVGLGVANPLAQIGSGAMMLDHLGEHAASTRIHAAIEAVIAEGVVTPDLGGTASTTEVAERVAHHVESADAASSD